jgi:ribosomal protein S18 acetylase RimI-like enzyme
VTTHQRQADVREPEAEANDPLDNAVWWALSTRHSGFAEVHGRARRYRGDISVFAAVDRFDQESWHDLAALFRPSRTGALFGSGLPGRLPDGWRTVARGQGRQLILAGDDLSEGEPITTRALTTDDVPQVLELVAATQPGPFRRGTMALGCYYGHFADDRLVAMAGERLGWAGSTEISAVCTHPELRGRGYAAALTRHVARGILERGERPFLHVAEANERACRVYERLGFRQRRLVDFAVVEAPSA